MDSSDSLSNACELPASSALGPASKPGYGSDCPLLAFTYPSFDCGSGVLTMSHPGIKPSALSCGRRVRFSSGKVGPYTDSPPVPSPWHTINSPCYERPLQQGAFEAVSGHNLLGDFAASQTPFLTWGILLLFLAVPFLRTISHGWRSFRDPKKKFALLAKHTGCDKHLASSWPSEILPVPSGNG